MSNNNYQDDALKMRSDTSLDEIKHFVKGRIENPYVINGKIIWDFCNHVPNFSALEFCTENKLQKSRYIIPFQVTGTWSLIMLMLPEPLQKSEILVFKPEKNDYAAYRNFIKDMEDNGGLNPFREELTEIIDSLSFN